MISKIKTVGYAGIGYTSQEMIAKLGEIMTSTTILVDVRAKPFGRLNMPELKEAFGFQYFSARGWGWPEYKIDETFNQQFSNLLKYMKERYDTIILMCAEKDIEECHRKDVAEMLNKKYPEASVEHLFQEGVVHKKKKPAESLGMFML